MGPVGSLCYGAVGDAAPLRSLVFGALTCATGVLGVGSGVSLSQWLRPHWPHADPLQIGRASCRERV